MKRAYSVRYVVVAAMALTGAIASPARAANWDHAHILAPNAAEAAQWYATHFGGKAIKSGPFEAVVYGDILVKFRTSTPETKGSAGSSIDHIGFSVPDLAAKMEELKAAGVKVTGEIKNVAAGDFSYAFVEDPWGTRIEILDDQELLGFHHVHLRSPDPTAAVAWYAENIGGEATLFKGVAAIPGIRYGAMWVLVGKAETVEGSVGHSIDHIGFQFDDFDTAIKSLQDKQTEFLQGPQPAEKPVMAYILGPDGVKIETVREPGAR